MKMRKLLPLLLVLLLCLTACSAPSGDDSAAPASEGSVTVVDIVGREKTIDYVPQRIAAIAGPTYEMTFMLGGQDRVVMVKSGHTTNYPVALLTNPDLANYQGIAANPSSSVNIEDYLQNQVDLVLYYDNETELAKFDNAGIPSVVITVNTGLLDSLEAAKTQTIDEYIETLTYPMSVLADLLQSEEAQAEYEEWKAYCAEKLHMIYDRTSTLTDDQRKSVYWANTWGENVLSTYVLKNRYYEVRLAGGDLIGPDGVSGNFPEITKEQFFTWDPEVILVDNHGGHPELVAKDLYNNPTWETLSAVQNEQIFRIPAGVFFLDKGSTTTLLVLWMATILQPELFSDVDMVEEVKNYYSQFYEYDLTDEEAQKVLDGWIDKK